MKRKDISLITHYALSPICGETSEPQKPVWLPSICDRDFVRRIGPGEIPFEVETFKKELGVQFQV